MGLYEDALAAAQSRVSPALPQESVPDVSGILATPSAKPVKGVGEEFVSGLAEGTLGLASSVGGVLKVAGDAIGSETLSRVGKETIDYWDEKAQPFAGDVSDYRQIKGLNDALKYAAHGVGSVVPTTAVSLIGGGVGGALAKGATSGIVAGAGAASLGLEAGSIGAEQSKHGISDPVAALTAAVPAAALDVIPELNILAKIPAFQALRKLPIFSTQGGSNFLVRGAKEALKQGGMEGATEYAQTLIEQAGALQPVNLNEATNAAIIGGLTGGLFGGLGGAVTKPADVKKATTEALLQKAAGDETDLGALVDKNLSGMQGYLDVMQRLSTPQPAFQASANEGISAPVVTAPPTAGQFGDVVPAAPAAERLSVLQDGIPAFEHWGRSATPEAASVDTTPVAASTPAPTGYLGEEIPDQGSPLLSRPAGLPQIMNPETLPQYPEADVIGEAGTPLRSSLAVATDRIGVETPKAGASLGQFGTKQEMYRYALEQTGTPEGARAWMQKMGYPEGAQETVAAQPEPAPLAATIPDGVTKRDYLKAQKEATALVLTEGLDTAVRKYQELKSQVDEIDGESVVTKRDTSTLKGYESVLAQYNAVPKAGPTDIKFSRPYFSKVRDLVEAKLSGATSFDQLKKMLKNNGATDDEIAQTLGGLEGKQKVSKAEVLDELKAKEAEAVAPTETPAFKKWFGASKIVNEDGTPKLMYHGTAYDVTEFQGWYQDIAGHFTPDPNEAAGYAETGGDSMRENVPDEEITSADSIYPVYLRVENPFDFRNPEQVAKIAELSGVSSDQLATGLYHVMESRDVIEALKASGFDGYYEREAPEYELTNVAVFSPTQIKSATGNNGEFDPTNPDIRFARRSNDSTPTDRGSQAAVDLRGLDTQSRLDAVLGAFYGGKTPEGVTIAPSAKPVDPTVRDLAKVFGKKVELFTMKGEGPQAFYAGGDTLYLNDKSKQPHLQLFGHELTHAMRVDNEALYDYIEDTAHDSGFKPTVQLEHDWKLSSEAAREEVVAEFVGERLMQKQFWDRLANREPALFEKFVDLVRSLIAKVKAALKGKTGTAELYFKDVQKVEDAVLESLARYAKRNGTESGTVKEIQAKFAAAWHGSPHDHDKFSTAKIGSGEGAQAYGWGLYFAGKRGVAEWYQKSLSERLNYEPFQKWHNNIQTMFQIFKSERPELYTKFKQEIEQWDGRGGMLPDSVLANYFRETYTDKGAGRISEATSAAIKEHTEYATPDYVPVAAPKGRLYKVELAPQENEYLNWDKPVSESPTTAKALPQIREALGEDFVSDWEDRLNADMGEWSGKVLYKVLMQYASESAFPGDITEGGNPKAEASKYLHSLGVRGIKYLDGTSRSKGSGDHNYVIFNDADVQIKAKFSRGDIQAIGERAKPAIANIVSKGFRVFGPLDRVIDAYSSRPAFAPLKETMQALKKVKRNSDNIQNTLLTESFLHYDEAMKAAGYAENPLKRNDPEFETNVNRFHDVMLNGTLWGIFPERPADAQPWTAKQWVDADMVEKTGLTFDAAHAQMQADYEALPKALRDTYHKIQAQTKKASDAYIAALKKKIVDNTQAGPEQDALVAKIDERFSRIKGPYTPLTRYGDHVLNVYEQQGGKRLKQIQFESYFDMLKERQKLTAEGLWTEVSKRKSWNREESHIPADFLKAIEGIVRDSGTNSETADGILSDIDQLWFTTLPETSVMKHSLRRSGLAGYDRDSLRGYLSYINKVARATSYLTYGGELKSVMDQMDAAVDAQTKAGEDPTQLAELVQFFRDQDNYVRTERISPITRALSAVPFLWYLASPSTFVVQSTQPFAFTLPKLASIHGLGESFKAITKGYKNQIDGAFQSEKLERFSAQAEEALELQRSGDTAGVKRLLKGMTPEDQKLLAIKMGELGGTFNISLTHEALDVVTNGGRSPRSKFLQNAAVFMRVSELMSRKASFAAAFDLEFKRTKDFEKAVAYGESVVDDTLFNYSQSNRPIVLTGNLGRLLGQFQTYRLNAVYKMIQLGMDSVRNESPEVRKAARKELAFMMGTVGTMAGATGLPFAGAAFAAINFLFGDGDDPFDAEETFASAMRKTLGDTAGNVALKGLPALFGADVSKRVGMEGMFNLFNSDPPENLKGSDRYNWYAGKLTGPIGGVASGLFRSGAAFEKGDWYEAVKAAAPKPIADLTKAIQLADEGQSTASGRTLQPADSFTMYDWALAAVGLQPLSMSLASEEHRVVSQVSARIADRRSELTGKLARAVATDDAMGRDAAAEEIAKFNRKVPGFALKSSDIAGAIKRELNARNGIKTPKEQQIQGMLKGGV